MTPSGVNVETLAGGIVEPVPRPAGTAALRALWSSAWPWLPGALLPILGFLLFGRIGLSLWDEGFLWYGAQRVLAGEFPVRDFQAYDPARYVWSAAWMWMSGSHGILPVRAGNAVLAAGCVMLGLRLVQSADRRALQRSAPLFALAGVVLAAWMVPLIKVSDSFAALLLIAGLAAALRSRRPRHWALAGLCLGVASMVGINHALYGGVGFALAAVWLRLSARHRPTWRDAAALVGGALLGYAPMLACDLFVPGFAAAFIDSIRQLAEAGSTNLTLPLPRVSALFDAQSMTLPKRVWSALIGVAFLAMPLLLALCVWRTLRPDAAAPAASSTSGASRQTPAVRRSHPVFVAAVALALPYLHYAYSRADLVHLAISALPLVIAGWTWPMHDERNEPDSGHGPGRRIALGLIAAFSLMLSVPAHSVFDVLIGETLTDVTVLRERLRVRPVQAAELALLQRLADQHAPGDGSFYVAPYWPGAYAALDRRSPAWEIYPLFPSRPERQQREIARLESAGIGFALLSDKRVDGRADLGLANTHPALVRWIRDCMAPWVPPPGRTVPGVQVYVSAPLRCAED